MDNPSQPRQTIVPLESTEVHRSKPQTYKMLYFQQFNMTIKYQAGIINQNADGFYQDKHGMMFKKTWTTLMTGNGMAKRRTTV